MNTQIFFDKMKEYEDGNYEQKIIETQEEFSFSCGLILGILAEKYPNNKKNSFGFNPNTYLAMKNNKQLKIAIINLIKKFKLYNSTTNSLENRLYEEIAAFEAEDKTDKNLSPVIFNGFIDTHNWRSKSELVAKTYRLPGSTVHIFKEHCDNAGSNMGATLDSIIRNYVSFKPSDTQLQLMSDYINEGVGLVIDWMKGILDGDTYSHKIEELIDQASQNLDDQYKHVFIITMINVRDKAR